jgi:hypothetical protein
VNVEIAIKLNQLRNSSISKTSSRELDAIRNAIAVPTLPAPIIEINFYNLILCKIKFDHIFYAFLNQSQNHKASQVP